MKIVATVIVSVTLAFAFGTYAQEVTSTVVKDGVCATPTVVLPSAPTVVVLPAGPTTVLPSDVTVV